MPESGPQSRVSDSACPSCGCGEAEVLRAPTSGEWFGAGVARCTHCDREYRFTEQSQPAERPVYRIVRPRLRCPRCRTIDVRVNTTRPEKDEGGETIPEGSVLRYYTCNACTYTFSLLER